MGTICGFGVDYVAFWNLLSVVEIWIEISFFSKTFRIVIHIHKLTYGIHMGNMVHKITFTQVHRNFAIWRTLLENSGTTEKKEIHEYQTNFPAIK
jgi:hypothetical protein